MLSTFFPFTLSILLFYFLATVCRWNRSFYPFLRLTTLLSAQPSHRKAIIGSQMRDRSTINYIHECFIASPFLASINIKFIARQLSNFTSYSLTKNSLFYFHRLSLKISSTFCYFVSAELNFIQNRGFTYFVQHHEEIMSIFLAKKFKQHFILNFLRTAEIFNFLSSNFLGETTKAEFLNYSFLCLASQRGDFP